MRVGAASAAFLPRVGSLGSFGSEGSWGGEGREGSLGSLRAEISVLIGRSVGAEREMGSVVPLTNVREAERASPGAGTKADIVTQRMVQWEVEHGMTNWNGCDGTNCLTNGIGRRRTLPPPETVHSRWKWREPKTSGGRRIISYCTH